MGKRNMGGGGMNKQMSQLMKQAQQMQKEMEKAQGELEDKEFEVSSGGGAVTVKINGKREILAIDIDKDVVDPDDVEMLEDLILTAVNESLRQVAESSEEDMSKLTGGMNIPGLF